MKVDERYIPIKKTLVYVCKLSIGQEKHIRYILTTHQHAKQGLTLTAFACLSA